MLNKKKNMVHHGSSFFRGSKPLKSWPFFLTPRNQRSSHQAMVTRLPNHWCANSSPEATQRSSQRTSESSWYDMIDGVQCFVFPFDHCFWWVVWCVECFFFCIILYHIWHALTCSVYTTRVAVIEKLQGWFRRNAAFWSVNDLSIKKTEFPRVCKMEVIVIIRWNQWSLCRLLVLIPDNMELLFVLHHWSYRVVGG